MAGRVQKVQQEIVARYNRVTNLYIAYMNSGELPDVIGREFFHAVGDVLQGKPVEQLELYHIDASSVESVVRHPATRGGKAAKKKKKPAPKRKAAKKGKASKRRR